MTLDLRLRYLGSLDDEDAEVLAAVRALDVLCFGAEHESFELGRGAVWWVVGDSDFPAAYGAIRPSVRWSDCAYLCRAGVRREFRGMGLQRRLIDARTAWARRRGFAYAITDTAAWNAGSANNLLAAGFRVWTPAVCWAGDGALYLSKRLHRTARAAGPQLPDVTGPGLGRAP